MPPSALLCLCLAVGDAPATIDLFDGKTLKGWVVEGPKDFKDGDKAVPVWVAKGGVLSCMVTRGSFGFLRYDKVVKDFHLSLEYRFEKPAGAKPRPGNSGIGIRTVAFDPKKSTATRPSYAGYEVQLLDDADKKPNKHSTGSLYRYVAPTRQAAKAAPAWNKIEIECVGPRIKITLNGKLVLDVDQSQVEEIKNKPLKGYVCLQNHGSRVDFRHIKLREIQGKE